MPRYLRSGFPTKIINNNLYQIIAEYPIERVNNSNLIKEWLNCEITFKDNMTQTYLFCVQINDAIIIDDNLIIEEKPTNI